MIRGLRKIPWLGTILWRHRGYWHILKRLPTLAREVCYSHAAFSQFGEDVVLATLLGSDRKQGFYVDVGAFNPVEYSNTYRFYKQGWTGINIEPNPESFAAFPRDRGRDINLNIAVSDARSVVRFHCFSARSGIVDPGYVFRSSTDSTRVIEVRTAPLGEILRQHLPVGTEIDFLSVDCEGHDFTVLRSNDWDAFRPKVVLIEQHGPVIESEAFRFLENVDYRFYCKVGLTLMFLRNDFAKGRLPGTGAAARLD